MSTKLCGQFLRLPNTLSVLLAFCTFLSVMYLLPSKIPRMLFAALGENIKSVREVNVLLEKTWKLSPPHQLITGCACFLNGINSWMSWTICQLALSRENLFHRYLLDPFINWHQNSQQFSLPLPKFPIILLHINVTGRENSTSRHEDWCRQIRMDWCSTIALERTLPSLLLFTDRNQDFNTGNIIVT